MSKDKESDPGFQVRDRRRRDEEESSSPVEERRDPRPERPEARPGPPRPEEARPEPPGPGERNLVGLFMMVASLAVAALEGLEDPATGQSHRDPEQAADLIDMLMLLRDKTDGHRTPVESQALEDLIYDLQLRYVKVVGRPA
jgi:hypothetical protein